jgi:hypothetical protein
MGTMSFKPLFRLARDGQLTPLIGVNSELKSFYRLTYLAAAGEAGLLHRLAAGPATLDALAEFCEARGQGREALEAWLQMGIRLRLLSSDTRGYSLRGLAATLARPQNDATLAMVQEVAGLHHKLIAATLPRLRTGELWTLADQDGELIARSSRILEAFQSISVPGVSKTASRSRMEISAQNPPAIASTSSPSTTTSTTSRSKNVSPCSNASPAFSRPADFSSSPLAARAEVSEPKH